MLTIRKSLAGAVVALLSFGSSAIASPIDSFTGSPGTFGSGSGPTLQSNLPTGTPPLFANRSVTTDRALGFGEGVQVGAGLFNVSSFGPGFVTNLSYSGFGSIALNPTGSISLDFVSVDLPFTGIVTLTDASNATLTSNFSVPAGPGGLNLLLSGFSGAGSLNQITNIQFSFNTGTGGTQADRDFVLRGGEGGIDIPIIPPGSPVPEPTTLLTFGALALFGGYSARRKLKTASVA